MLGEAEGLRRQDGVGTTLTCQLETHDRSKHCRPGGLTFGRVWRWRRLSRSGYRGAPGSGWHGKCRCPCPQNFSAMQSRDRFAMDAKKAENLKFPRFLSLLLHCTGSLRTRCWWRSTEPNPRPLSEPDSNTLALRAWIRRFGHRHCSEPKSNSSQSLPDQRKPSSSGMADAPFGRIEKCRLFPVVLSDQVAWQVPHWQ